MLKTFGLESFWGAPSDGSRKDFDPHRGTTSVVPVVVIAFRRCAAAKAELIFQTLWHG
jgi:hypothetical protein